MSEWSDVFRYDETRLATSLSMLRPAARALFTCACAERLMPAYRWFCRATDSGGYTLVRESLDAAWTAAVKAEAEFGSLQKKVIGAIPHVDDPQMYLGHAVAQNAVACVAYAMEVCLTGDIQTSIWAARQLYEAADSVVQQGSAAQTYIADIDQQQPVRIMLAGIAAALDDVGSLDPAELRAKAEEDGGKFLAVLAGQAGY